MEVSRQVDGIVFNIQKFSLHDGPGIRTVVFLKGCPLRCLWCSNPESQSMGVQYAGSAMYGEWMTVEAALNICLQDEPFYRESGGGVTLSGGEMLMQPDFAIALLSALQERGIHTAIETTGYAAPDVFARVANHADLILFDIKHWDERKHIEGTGAGLSRILGNLLEATDRGCEVLPRIPIIPNYNDSLDDAKALANLIRAMGLRRAQLLPFHQFGEKKYEQLNIEYAYKDKKSYHQEDLLPYRDMMIDAGIEAYI